MTETFRIYLGTIGVNLLLAESSHPDAGAIFGAAAFRDVLAERLAQVERHGFTLAHDRGHHPGDLALAAASYLDTASDQLHGVNHSAREVPKTWPFMDGWRPKDARANLVKAIAIAWAAIDRIDNAPRDSGEADAPEVSSPDLAASEPLPSHSRRSPSCGCEMAVCPVCCPNVGVDAAVRSMQAELSQDGARPYGLSGYTCADLPLMAERKLRLIEITRAGDTEALALIEQLVDDAGPERARRWLESDDLPF